MPAWPDRSYPRQALMAQPFERRRASACSLGRRVQQPPIRSTRWLLGGRCARIAPHAAEKRDDLANTGRRRIVYVVCPNADRAGNPLWLNVSNPDHDLLDPLTRICKRPKQIACCEVWLPGEVLQGRPGSRAPDALPFRLERKQDEVPIPPWLRNKRFLPQVFHVGPKLHMSIPAATKSGHALRLPSGLGGPIARIIGQARGLRFRAGGHKHASLRPRRLQRGILDQLSTPMPQLQSEN
jgi:hypothetical protein